MKPVWIIFWASITLEIVATCFMKQVDGLRRPWLLFGVVAGIASSWGLFSICLKSIPVGMAYAIWSAVGIFFITLISCFMYDERPDFFGLLGLGLIVGGVTVLFTLSDMEVH